MVRDVISIWSIACYRKDWLWWKVGLVGSSSIVPGCSAYSSHGYLLYLYSWHVWYCKILWLIEINWNFLQESWGQENVFTLRILIMVYTRLFIFGKKSTLHGLIRSLHDYSFWKILLKNALFAQNRYKFARILSSYMLI